MANQSPIDVESLKELAKSIGRFIYFGLFGIVALILFAIVASPQVAGLTITIPWLEIKVSIGGVVVLTVGLIAKAIDLYVRKSQYTDAKGIAPGFLQK